MSKFEDKKLACEDCGTEFVWDASEQAYFAKKGFQKVPKRCRACRAQRQVEQQKEKAKEKEITCIKCDKKATITANIEPDEEALCFNCYLEEQNKE